MIDLNCKATGLPIPGDTRSARRRIVRFVDTVEEIVGQYPEEARRYDTDSGAFCSPDCLATYLLGADAIADEGVPCIAHATPVPPPEVEAPF